MRTTEKITTTKDFALRFLYNTVLGRILLKPLICKPVSVICGFFLNTAISSIFIKNFVKKRHIDMTEYENRKFDSFNDFFTRKVLEGKRPIDISENSLISPCDARLTAYKIGDNSSFLIKGVRYTIAELLENQHLKDEYNNGYCLIFRLAVDNYHRYCYCADGIIEKIIHIKGKYHTVQPIAMRKFKIFRENVREYTIINTNHFGKVIQMEVGALNVGKIQNYGQPLNKVLKGEEKGKFEFGGSTVILLIKENMLQIDQDIIKNTLNEFETNVKYGESIGVKVQKHSLG